jgi:sarcosine oxidase delta subunit
MPAPFRREYQLYADIVRYGILTMEPGDSPNKIKIALHSDPRHPDLLALASNVLQLGAATCQELICVGHYLAEGPKDFWLGDAREYEALEQFSLDLPAREYAQPFPTLRILLPDDYSRNRIVPFEHYLYHGDNTAGLHRPDWMICHHNPGAGRFNLLVHMTLGQYLTKSIRLNCDATLEQTWREANRPHGEAVTNTGVKLSDPLVQSPAEEELSNALSRLALAANLLLMVYGTRKIGHDNPAYAERLKRYVEVAHKRKDPERLARARWDYESLPIRYEFAQKVILYTHARQTEGELSLGHPGYPVRPHWRRGHLRNQRHGPGLTLVKRIAIPAVLVNAHLFAGDRAEVGVTYVLK